MKRLLPLLGLSLVLAGCAHASPEPVVVRVRDATASGALRDVGPDIGKRPLILELEPGDVVPLTFALEGDDIGTAPDQAPVPLVAKRHFFIRVSQEGFAISDDKEHFERPLRPGRFAFGIGADRSGVRATVHIVTPEHRHAR